jgi:excisionase family DNA binding protein
MRREGSQLSLQLLHADDGGRQRTKPRTAGKPAYLPRLSISPGEAAEMLGVSRDFFDEHIKPELRIVRRGSKTIMIPLVELERWLEKSAARYPI